MFHELTDPDSDPDLSLLGPGSSFFGSVAAWLVHMRKWETDSNGTLMLAQRCFLCHSKYMVQ